MLRSGMFIEACFLVLAVAATDDYDTCAASPGGCAAQTEADANTLMQANVRTSAGLAPYLQAEAGKNEAIKSEGFDLAKKFKSELHDVQNQRTLLQRDEAAAKKKAEEDFAEELAAKISEVEAQKKTASEVRDLAFAKMKAKIELLDLQNQAAQAAKAKRKAEEEAAEKAAQDALVAEERKAEATEEAAPKGIADAVPAEKNADEGTAAVLPAGENADEDGAHKANPKKSASQTPLVASLVIFTVVIASCWKMR